ncbi:VOC family protein [Comamonas sp.]|uniref:VOC family protein n=1 Tax=Comamonas sp. TaxID=34028 RepID=UPI0028AE64EA|nr:VOC family protein [Comamonas sp.]
MSHATLDHLVVMAASLDEGLAWCEATLGVTPDAGGQHAFMGTHNRLQRISSPAFAGSYLEIIAVDPQGQAPSSHRRWFDMDDSALQAQVRSQGPQLTHWVARVNGITQATEALRALGHAAGTPQAASRQTPRGLLAWQIGLRPDGQRLLQGLLPTLIEWGNQHPEANLAEKGVALQQLQLLHPDAAALHTALQALGLGSHPALQVAHAPTPALAADLHTPKEPVQLRSPL